MFHEQGHELGRDPLLAHVKLGTVLFQKIPHQKGDIFPAFSQGRHLNIDHV